MPPTQMEESALHSCDQGAKLEREYWRVWEYVGKEYTLERVEETCDFLNDKEFHLLKWIHNMLPEMSRGKTFSRSYRMNNGRNSQRKPSDGEMLVTVQTLSYE